jgi:hypothetical protein
MKAVLDLLNRASGDIRRKVCIQSPQQPIGLCCQNKSNEIVLLLAWTPVSVRPADSNRSPTQPQRHKASSTEPWTVLTCFWR